MPVLASVHLGQGPPLLLMRMLIAPGLVAATFACLQPVSRIGIVAVALLAGLTLALAVLPAAGPWLHGSAGATS